MVLHIKNMSKRYYLLRIFLITVQKENILRITWKKNQNILHHIDRQQSFYIQNVLERKKINSCSIIYIFLYPYLQHILFIVHRKKENIKI